MRKVKVEKDILDKRRKKFIIFFNKECSFTPFCVLGQFNKSGKFNACGVCSHADEYSLNLEDMTISCSIPNSLDFIMGEEKDET